MEYFHIVFPRGNKTKLSVVGFSDAMHYELNDYSVASRKEFTDESLAIDYAKELAEKHGLKYEGDDDGYLD